MSSREKSAISISPTVDQSTDSFLEPILLDVKAVGRLLSLPSSRIWSLLKTPEVGFPKPKHLGRSARWHYSDLVSWAHGLKEESVEIPSVSKEKARYGRIRQFKSVFNEATGAFDLVLARERFYKLKAVPNPITVPIRYARTGPIATGGLASEAKSPLAKQTKVQLVEDASIDIRSLREQYESGATVDALVSWHRIGKEKMLRLLRQAGTTMRKPGARRKPVHQWPMTEKLR